MTPYLCLSVNFEKFFFYRAPMENCLFHLQVAKFQPPRAVNKYFTYAFQVFYTRRRRGRTRSSYSKAFMRLKCQKIICEEANLPWSYEMPTYKLTKKSLSHILLNAFCFNFLRIHKNTFSNFASTTSFRKYEWKVVTGKHLFNHDSSKPFFFMLNMAFDVLLSTVSCNVRTTRTSCSVFSYVLFYKNLIVLTHGDNNFLFYFDICIKLTLSKIISTTKKWCML